MITEYKDIPGYEGLYQVSNTGLILSFPKGDGNGYKLRILKPDLIVRNHTTYQRVTLSKDGKTKRYQIHRLVAASFIPNPDNKPIVNHKDNNGQNNHKDNLEWSTFKENMEHSSSQGRQDSARSLGGKALGKIKHDKAVLDNKQLIGKTFGHLLVLDIFYDDTLKRPRFKATCKCSCGNTTTKHLYKLTTGTPVCIECSYKSR